MSVVIVSMTERTKKMVLDHLKDNKEIILITESQVNTFAGNMLSS
jgi:hypothetical protein